MNRWIPTCPAKPITLLLTTGPDPAYGQAHGMMRVQKVTTYQKSPPANAMPPMMQGGSRHSGMGTLLLASNFREYDF